MLIKIGIQNFKSIVNETISMETDIRAPNHYQDMDTISFLEKDLGSKKTRKKFVPVLMMFGANASGKSNMLEAISVMRRVVFGGIKEQYFPNKINNCYNSTRFDVCFSVNDAVYEYLIDYNKSEIIQERLSCNNEELFRIENCKPDFSNIERSNYSRDDLTEIFNVECTVKVDDKRSQRSSFINKITNKLTGLNEQITFARNYLLKDIMVSNSNEIPMSLQQLVDECDGDIKKATREIQNLLVKFDIDIEQINVERSDPEELQQDADGKYIIEINSKTSKDHFIDEAGGKPVIVCDKITTVHRTIENKAVEFSFRNEESMGTQLLFGLIAISLKALKNGSVLVVDELDRSLHPILFRNIVKLFKNKNYNKNNAQLIFTAHNPYILDDADIRVSEVCFVEKNRDKGSNIKYLSEFEDIRNVNNFRKQYLAGRFSAIPYVYL